MNEELQAQPDKLDKYRLLVEELRDISPDLTMRQGHLMLRAADAINELVWSH